MILHERVEKIAEKVTENPFFLSLISLSLNANANARNLIRQNLQKLISNLEISNREDQVKAMRMIAELEFKVKTLEQKLKKVEKLERVESVLSQGLDKGAGTSSGKNSGKLNSRLSEMV
jgi:hypothetical protein